MLLVVFPRGGGGDQELAVSGECDRTDEARGFEQVLNGNVERPLGRPGGGLWRGLVLREQSTRSIADPNCEGAYDQKRSRGGFQPGKIHGFQGSLHEGCDRSRDCGGGREVRLRGQRGQASSAIDKHGRNVQFESIECEYRGHRGARRSQSTAGQAAAKVLAAAGEPALDRAHRRAEQLGSLLVGEALEVAEHDRPAMPFPKLCQLLLELPLEVLTGIGLVGSRFGRQLGGLALVLRAPRRGSARVAGHPIGDRVQPGRERRLNPKRRGFLHQYQKRRLKRIFGQVLVAQDTAANALHERTVPLDEDRKDQLGRDRIANQESLEQLGIGQTARRARVE